MSQSNNDHELLEATVEEPNPESVDAGTGSAKQEFVKTKVEDQLGLAVDEVMAIWRRSAECYVSLALAIRNHHKTEYGIEFKRRLETEGLMKESVYSMFVKIGSSKILTDPENIELLPRSYNTLYHLAKLGEEALQELLDKGGISSCMRVDDCRNLPKKKKGKTNSSAIGKVAESKPHSDSREILITVSQENWIKHSVIISDLLDRIRRLEYLNLDLDEEMADV